MRKSMVLAYACIALTFVMAEDEDALDMEENMISFRETMNQTKADTLMLPSNATSIRENITDTFKCENRTYGYYADVDNDCQLFHVCLPVSTPDGKNQTYRWSFICPAETVFNQTFRATETFALQLYFSSGVYFSMVLRHYRPDEPEGEAFVCVRKEDSIECEDSPMLYYLNDEFGKEENKSLNETNRATSPKNNIQEESVRDGKIGSMRKFLYKPLLEAVIASSNSEIDNPITHVEEDEEVIGEIESKTDSLSHVPDINQWIIQDRNYLSKSGKYGFESRNGRKMDGRGSIRYKDSI